MPQRHWRIGWPRVLRLKIRFAKDPWTHQFTNLLLLIFFLKERYSNWCNLFRQRCHEVPWNIHSWWQGYMPPPSQTHNCLSHAGLKRRHDSKKPSLRSLKIRRYRFNLQWHSDDTNKVSSSVNSWINFVTCLIVLHPNSPRPAKWIPNAIWRLERSDTHPLEGMWFPAKKARSPFRGSSNDHCMTAEDGSNLASAESTSIEEWWRMKHGNFKDHMMFHLFNVLDPSSATSFIIFQNPLSFTFHAIMKQFMNKEVLHPHTPSAP